MSQSSLRAVVIGNGLAGIAAAAALRNRCEEVVVVERDDIAVAGSASRPGVPQGDQLHNLLTSAQRGLEALLPGFCDELREAGAGEARVAADTEVFEWGERMPLRDLGLRLMCAPRPTIEQVARRRLLESANIRVLERARAHGLELDASGAVAGVSVDVDGRPRSIRAPLVVDATGFRAAGARWLKAAGLDGPPVETERVERWYVSARFERAAEDFHRDRFWLVFPTPPATRSGLVSPLGGRHWHVSLSGSFAERPPLSVEAMRDYAATLEAPWIADLIEGSGGGGKPHLFRKPWATWRRYDRMSRPLPGLLPVGDSVATLNPLFGQGMSVAATQAVALGRLLEASDGVEGLTREYLSRSADACRSAWQLGRVVERRKGAAEFVPPAGDRPAAELLRDDPDLHRRYVGVWHLIEPAASLPRNVLPALEPV